MFCRFCGAEILEDSVFCSKCGGKVEAINRTSEENNFSVEDFFDDVLEPISSENFTENNQKDNNDIVNENTFKALQANGTANAWTSIYDDEVYVVNVDDEVRTSDGMYIHCDGAREKILDGIAIESFKINQKFDKIIFKRQEKGNKCSLWACDTDGENVVMIAGGNDNVCYFAVTNNWIFAVVENKNEEKFIYKISADLQQASVIKKNVDIRRPIAADEQFLYYATWSEPNGHNPNKMGIVQYNIFNNTEKFIINDTGISAFQLYRKHIIVNTYTDCMVKYSDKLKHLNKNELKIIDTSNMLIRPLSTEQISTKIFSVYLEHVFYIDEETGYLYALNIRDGATHLVYNRSIAHIDLSSGMLHVIDIQKEQMVVMEIFGVTSKTAEGYTGYTIDIPSADVMHGVPKYIENPKKNQSTTQTIKKENQIVKGMIVASDSHTVALKSNGTVVAVGKNKFGACNVSEWSDIKMIAAGSRHTVGLKFDGRVIATDFIGDDYDYYGQCDVQNWNNIISVSAGGMHTVGLNKNGTVVAVGNNVYEQCNVDTWVDVIKISAGFTHTVALTSNGTVIAVGENRCGECDISNWTDIVEIFAGNNYTLGLKSNGTVVAVGNNECGQCNVNDWTDIVEIAGGTGHSVGLKSNGNVITTKCLDFDIDEGQFGTDEWFDIISVSAGNFHTVGLKKNGSLIATEYIGDDYFGQCNVDDIILFNDISNVEQLNSIKSKLQENTQNENTYSEKSESLNQAQDSFVNDFSNKLKYLICNTEGLISAGSLHSMGLKTNGTVVAKGSNTWGECDLSDWFDIAAISAGVAHSVGLLSNGKVVAKGRNEEGQCNVSNWSNIVQISANLKFTVGLKADGTVVAIGLNDCGQCNVSGWSNIIAVSAGRYHTVGLKANGSVVSTKCTNPKYEHGQANVEQWNDIVEIAAGNFHTIALKKDGTVLATGLNDAGQCNLQKWKDVYKIAAGVQSFGIRADGIVLMNESEILDNTHSVVSINAGNMGILALKSDGTIVAVGKNKEGECDITGIQLFSDIENILEEKERKRNMESSRRRNYISSGLCAFCGGEFKGLFTKKCSKCGKEKTY